MPVTFPTKANEVPKLIDARIAGENISALKVVRLINENEVLIASKDTFGEAQALGVALNAALTGEQIRVLSLGILEDAFFTFPLNDLLFLDSSGNITNVEPLSGTRTVVGKSLGPGSIYVKLEEPIVII